MKSIRLTIKENIISKIEGGKEADALSRFLISMCEYLEERVYDFDHMHSGVHPQAAVAPYQCPGVIYRRVIEHSHSSNIHFHIGGPRLLQNIHTGCTLPVISETPPYASGRTWPMTEDIFQQWMTRLSARWQPDIRGVPAWRPLQIPVSYFIRIH